MSRKILVVDDDAPTRASLQSHLTACGYVVMAVESAEAALNVIHSFDPAIIVTDVQMEGMSGLDLLQRVRRDAPGSDVLVVTGYEDMPSTIGAIRDGAYDYLVKPVDVELLDVVLQRYFRDREARYREAPSPTSTNDTTYFAGGSPTMIEIYKQIGMLAEARVPVLIRGETGTGKELIAQAIHQFSSSAAAPFVAINCTAIAETLLESELFGHVRGAFTGAGHDRKGRFEQAGEGTLFLDEIGDTSPAFQAKLLRVIEQREFYPVGGDVPHRSMVRVVAATHRPIEQMIVEGTFREDLYFRLRVVEIVIPPLRERVEDIPLIAEHLLAKASRALHKGVRVIPPDVMHIFKTYRWPGNVREMENAIARAVILSRGTTLSAEHFPFARGSAVVSARSTKGQTGPRSLEEMERAHVEHVLEWTAGNKRRAAGILGISRPRLDRLLNKFAAEPPV